MIIKFDLNPVQETLPLPLLLARGYNKKQIILCFEELEKLNYGKFYRGKPGRSHFAIFYPNVECPKYFEMEFKDKKEKVEVLNFKYPKE